MSSTIISINRRMLRHHQLSFKMSSLELNRSKFPIDRACSRNFKPLNQVLSLHEAVSTLIIILLILCAINNGFLTKTTATATTIAEESKERTIKDLQDYKENSIATGGFYNGHRIIKRSNKEDKTKQPNNWQIRSSRKSYTGMINGESLFRPTTAERKKEEEVQEKARRPKEEEEERKETIDIEQIGQRSQEGVIDFGRAVSQYATFAVQNGLDGEKEAVSSTGTQNNKLALQEIGLEHRNNRKKSNNKNKNKNKTENNNNENDNENDNSNQDDNDHNKHKQASSTRRKRFQDSDRLQTSDISDENSENSDSASSSSFSREDFVAESDSGNNGSQFNSSGNESTVEVAPTFVPTSTSTPASTPTPTSSSTSKSPSFDMGDTSKLKCRVERDLYLDFETYKHYSCANCYNGMPDFLFINKLFYDRRKDRIRLTDLAKKRKLLPNETETIRSTFRAENTFKNWQECCSKALECCVENQKYLPKTVNQLGELIDDDDGLNGDEENGTDGNRRGKGRDKCHATWDGLGCWPDSPAGAIAYRDCPDHAYFLEFVPICRGRVSKQCFSNGSWFMRTDHEWSDYSGCSGKAIYGTRLLIASVWHLVSVIIIGPALIVLSKLPNRGGSKRVRILSNLLFWLLLNGLLAATYKIGIIGGYFQRTEANSEQPPPPPPAQIFDNSNSSSNNNNNSGSLTLITSSGPPPSSGATTTTTSDLVSQQMLIYDENNVTKTFSGRNKRHILNSNYSHSDYKTKNEATRLEELEEGNEEFFDLWRQRLQRPKYRFKFGRKFGNEICDSNEGDYENNDYNSHYPTKLNNNGNENSKEFDFKGHFKGAAKKYNHLNGILSTMLNKTDNHHAMIASPSSDSNSQPNPQNLIIGGSGLDSYNNHKISSPFNNNEKLNPPRRSSSPLSVSLKSNTAARCKRDTRHKKKQGQSTFLVSICWIFTVGIRITRLLGYAWMFTGAVYLCSVLHFAPAEPPVSYIRWLMYLTNGFPVVIGLTYIIVRTIHEPSPLNILVKVPYYHLMGDMKQVDYLWASQLTCWTGQSKYDYIEEIADSPNYVLVILNGVLFVITLIIMCRITRPGSTRPEMSPGDYFKAAGTLVLLYGAHYALLAYRPPEESCIIGQVMHYSFLFVDGIQGIAVSYVFCYRTIEGREIIHKWFTSLRESNRLQWCGFTRKKHVQIITSSKHGLLRASNKSNQSTRSTNSACNGNDPATELININNNSRNTSQF